MMPSVVPRGFRSALLASMRRVDERALRAGLAGDGWKGRALPVVSEQSWLCGANEEYIYIFHPSQNYSAAGIAKVPEKQIFYGSGQRFKIFSFLF